MTGGVGSWRSRVERYLERDLWQRESGGGVAARVGRQLLQVAVIVAQGVSRNQTMLRASALTYFTVLSLVPLLALVISLVDAFGAGSNVVDLVVGQISTVSPEAGTWLAQRIQKVDFASLGGMSGALLFVTTVLALSNVEKALNHIWGVERQRPLVRRFPDYLAVLVVAPLMLTLALSLATTLRSETLVARIFEQPGLALISQVGLRIAPAFLFWVAFAFLYWFLPNTTVRPAPALAGGALAAVLFSLLQWGYVTFQVGVARSNALFGSFAFLPILLVWIYFSWAIVLLGAELAFASQNLGSFRQAREGEEPTPAAREAITLAVATQIARVFRSGAGAVDDERLAAELDVPVRTVRSILTQLTAGGVIAPRGDPKLGGWQLGRAAESIKVLDVLAALRGPRAFAGHERPQDERIRQLVADLDRGLAEAAAGRTLADILDGEPPTRGAGAVARAVDPRPARS